MFLNYFRVSQALILGTTSIANSLAFTPNFTKGLEAARNVKRFLARVPGVRDNTNATVKYTVSKIKSLLLVVSTNKKEIIKTVYVLSLSFYLKLDFIFFDAIAIAF